MRKVAHAADAAMKIDGAIGVAIVDERTGDVVIQIGGRGELSLGLATTINSKLVRANTEMTHESAALNQMVDILVTFDTQYHIIRPIVCDQKPTGLFFFLALDQKQANLGMARHKIAEIERGLDLSSEELDALKPFQPSVGMSLQPGMGTKMPSIMEDDDEELPPFMRESNVRKLIGLK